MALKVEIIGMKETVENLKEINRKIIQSTMVAISEGGILLKEEIEQSIQGNRAESRSVDTGEVLESIENTNITGGVKISSDVPQSVYMEFGTSKIPERRHFRNSLERVKPIIEERIVEEIVKTI